MREYGKAVLLSGTNKFNSYYEVLYTDYREDGSICGKGTEDFSGERLKSIKNYEVREFDCIGTTGNKRTTSFSWIRTINKKSAVAIAKIKYPNINIARIDFVI